jgi:type I restriction enzyme, S subunit
MQVFDPATAKTRRCRNSYVPQTMPPFTVNANWRSLPLFDHSRWQTVRFGDVVDNVNETEREPVEAGIECFIGMEHLEPGSLHIREWGNVADGTTFTRLCHPGQVLFGKRRAYQRKVAVAEFDAVVSGDIYVLAPKDDRLLPELLPFLCLSERFFQHAVGTSAGSLSPRTNWSSLATFEFALPPPDQQRRIAEVLWALNTVIEEFRNLRSAAQRWSDSIKDNHFLHSKQSRRPLHVAVQSSAYGPRFSNALYSPSGAVAQLRTTDISELGEISYGTIPRVNLDVSELHQHILQNGDFVISRSGTCGIGAVYRNKGVPTIPGAFLIRLRLNDNLLSEYLCEYVNSSLGRRQMNTIAAGGVQKNIRGSSLLREEVPMPATATQLAFLEECAKQRHLLATVEDTIYYARRMLASLLDQV